ncbi:MAG: hypothetical protein COV70_00610 [Parcubacteria group bacterium CG11_big_fil_rev_8_21_14_0_20_39_22]|nr:MAG: hypothetical protein COV70_00610 [Parcubacteria group bacterium CG11_big_fil_rev_8_21_14_0_20_39_22]
MKNAKSLFFLGVLLVMLPWLGFPFSWDSFFIVIIGLLVIMISRSVRKTEISSQNLQGKSKKTKTSSPVFVENREKADQSSGFASAVASLSANSSKEDNVALES